MTSTNVRIEFDSNAVQNAVKKSSLKPLLWPELVLIFGNLPGTLFHVQRNLLLPDHHLTPVAAF